MLKTTSLGLSKQLKENGFPQETSFYWNVEREKIVYAPNISLFDYIASPTAEEILDRLPVYVRFEKESLPFTLRIEKEIGGDFLDEYVVVYVRYSKTLHSEKDYQERGRSTNESLSEAAGKMFLYLKKEGLL